MIQNISTSILFFITLLQKANGGCYFPVEVQGEYVTQSMIDTEIAYTSVTVTYDSIPGWGQCYSRHGLGGHLHILQDVTVNGDYCYKCIKMQVRSANVMQVHTVDNIYQCHSSPEEARSTCPTVTDITGIVATEVMLYKTRGYYGSRDNFAQVLCPVFGTWRFSYTDHSDMSQSCSSPASRASNCQFGYKIELQFRGCSFPDHSMQFKCLGSWQGEDGQHYVSLLDTKLVQMDEAPHPRYRCGIYKHDHNIGVTWLSLSNDSTCQNQLLSHNRGHQTIQLHDIKPGPRKCNLGGYTLPHWSHGDWGEVRIQAGVLVYRDHDNFVQYQLTAVSGTGQEDRYLVRVEAGHCRSQSGYACLALEHRNTNVIEMMLGHVVSRYEHGDTLCGHQDTFLDKHWTTLTRVEDMVSHQSQLTDSCPLIGQYSGKVPDGEGLCARSTTLCDRPDLMRYQVYLCNNTMEVYEDRLYKCYGVFQETGLTYTAVRRLDLPNKECFVGITVTNGNKKAHKIIEAGTDCGRGKDPESFGMVLEYDSDTCDIDNKEDENQHYVNKSIDFGDLVCEEESQELINADLNNDINEHVPDIISEESIDSSNRTEAVNQIVTQISGSTIPNCHLWTLTTLLVTILIIQH